MFKRRDEDNSFVYLLQLEIQVHECLGSTFKNANNASEMRDYKIVFWKGWFNTNAQRSLVRKKKPLLADIVLEKRRLAVHFDSCLRNYFRSRKNFIVADI
jgi:hypothetical protein